MLVGEAVASMSECDELSNASLHSSVDLFHRWIRDAGVLSLPSETHATCSSCAMVTNSSVGFRPNLKCCSYQPLLANFQVGSILASTEVASEAQKSIIRQRISDGTAVWHLGIDPLPSLHLLYRQTSEQTFGHSVKLRCPHFVQSDGGTCGIWRHRNSVCFTWYCKHERGALGARFWAALRGLLQAMELESAEYCADALGLGSKSRRGRQPGDERNAALVAELNGPSNSSSDPSKWNEWAGRVEEYFIETWRVMKSVGSKPLERPSPAVALALAAVREAQAALSETDVPIRLRVGKFDIAPESPRAWRLATYSKNDPIVVPSELIAVLSQFDGRELQAVRTTIADEFDLVLEMDLVQKLLDYRVLVSVDETRLEESVLDPSDKVRAP